MAQKYHLVEDLAAENRQIDIYERSLSQVRSMVKLLQGELKYPRLQKQAILDRSEVLFEGTTSQKGKLAEKLLEIDQVREEVLTDRIKASKLDIEHLECRIRPRKLAQQHLQAKLNANLCKLQQLDQSSPPLKVIMTKKGTNRKTSTSACRAGEHCKSTRLNLENADPTRMRKEVGWGKLGTNFLHAILDNVIPGGRKTNEGSIVKELELLLPKAE